MDDETYQLQPNKANCNYLNSESDSNNHGFHRHSKQTHAAVSSKACEGRDGAWSSAAEPAPIQAKAVNYICRGYQRAVCLVSGDVSK